MEIGLALSSSYSWNGRCVSVSTRISNAVGQNT